MRLVDTVVTAVVLSTNEINEKSDLSSIKDQTPTVYSPNSKYDEFHVSRLTEYEPVESTVVVV